MSWKRPLFALVFTLFATLGCAAYLERPGPPAWKQPPSAEVSFFYGALAPYGDWIWVEPWGWVWTPWDVEPGWRPYTDGRWAWTTLGWTWISDWPWGWAPFHYGRWTYEAVYGWIWVPDTVWAPAWVAWRSGPGWIGWAPLPPGARWRIGIGLDLGSVDLTLGIVEHGWCFVPDRDFLAPHVHGRLAPLPRHRYLLRETRDRTRYEEVEHRVAVRAFAPEEIEPRTGRVERYRIEDLERPPNEREAVGRNAVRVFRPEVQEEAPGRAPERRAQPAPAPPSDASKERKEMERRKARDDRELKDWEERQRRQLDEEHRKEQRNPPQGESDVEVRQRQEKERRALSDEAKRERELQDNRRDRRAREKESAAGQKPARRKPPQDEKKEDGGGVALLRGGDAPTCRTGRRPTCPRERATRRSVGRLRSPS